MKRILSLILVVLMCVSLVPAAFAEEECTEHSWTEDSVISESTCTVQGSMKYVCSACGAEKTEALPLAEHSWGEGTVLSESTCTVQGSVKYVCSACGAEKTEALPLAEHSWGEGTVTKDATCTECGTEHFCCEAEGCSAEKDEATATIPHTYGSDGKCTVCADDVLARITEAVNSLTQSAEGVDDSEKAGAWLESYSAFIAGADYRAVFGPDGKQPAEFAGEELAAAQNALSAKAAEIRKEYIPVTKAMADAPATYPLTVTVKWSDGNDRDGKRPSSSTITVKKGEETVGSFTATSANSWSNTFNLEPGEYTITQTCSADGYTVTESSDVTLGEAAASQEMENTHTPITITATPKIKWIDKNNLHKERPKEVEITLYYSLDNGKTYKKNISTTIPTPAEDDGKTIYTSSVTTVQTMEGDKTAAYWNTGSDIQITFGNLPAYALNDKGKSVKVYYKAVAKDVKYYTSYSEGVVFTAGDITPVVEMYNRYYPKTGDSSNTGLYTALMLMALVSFGGTAYVYRKKKN